MPIAWWASFANCSNPEPHIPVIYLLAVPGPIEDVEEVRVLEWHGEPERVFATGDLIVELETYKALVEVRAGQPGVLRRILTQAGDWQRPGGLLALLSDDLEEALPEAIGNIPPLAVEFAIS
jgi:pyruvate/2-oxoglutarate dehydrogenase complex dihydrolipoamide acyltransferase (E2) component